MFEKQISDLLATSLRRFVRNLNEEQLQVSVWSGEVVLRDLELQDDILEQLSLLLLPKPSTESMANDSDNQPSSYSESESSARSLLLPFTVVRGVIHELVIHLPWSSLDSEPVEVEVHGVEIEFGPLRCRRYDPEEERARVELMKHECLKKFERSHRKTSEGSSSRADLPQASRDRGATPTLTRTPDAGSSRSSTPPKEVVHSPSRLSPSSPSGFLSSLSPMSYFEGLVDTIVRNAQFLLRHVSIVFRMDYAGLHPSLAKSVLWWLTEVRITTVNDLCRGAFFADAGGNMSKHIAVKGLEVSVFSELDNEEGCAASDLSGPCMEASSSSQSSGEGIVDEHAADFRKQWRFRQRLASIDCCTFQCRLSRPHSLRVSCTSDMKLEASFGSILVVEQLLEQLTHSLQYAKYRKHLHLLLPSTTTEMHNIHRRRWIFAINCVLDEVRSRQANLLGGGLGDRIAAFCNIRRSYCLLWKRQSQAHWYPPLDPQENLEVVRLEQMLTVDQIVFLRCFARAEVQTEAAQYEQQRQWIADAAARRGASQVKASKWWGWGSKSRVEKPPTDVATPSSSGRLSAAASTSGFANVLNKEWSSAQQFLKDRVAPLMPGNSTARRGSTSGQPAFLSSSSMLSCPGLRLTFYPTYWGRTAPTYAPPLQQLQQHLVVSLGQLDMSHNGAATMMAHTTRIIVNSVSAELCGPVRMPLLQSRASERQDWLNMDITKAGRHVAIHMSLVVAVIRPTHELRWWIDGIATFGRLWTTHRALRRSSMDPSPALGTSNSADSMPVSTLGRSSLEIEVRVNGAHVVVPLTSDDVEMDEVLCEESAASVPIPVAPSACVAQQQHSHADPSPPLDDNRSSEGEEVWRGDATSPITPGAPVVPHNEGQRQDSVVNSFGEDEVQVVAPLQPISLKKVFVKGASCLIFSTPIVDASALWTPVNYGSMWELQCEAQVGDGEGIATTLYCHTPVLNAEVLLASRRDILTFSHFIVAVEDRLVGLDVYGAAEVVVDPLTVGLLSHHFVKPPSPFADSSVHEEIYALLQKQKQDRPHDTSCCWNMMADEGTLSVGEGHSASCYSIRPGCQREAATLMHEWCSAIFAADLPRNAEATEVQATESKGWRFLAAVGLLRVAVRDRNSDLVAELEVVPSPGETLPSDSPFRSPLFTGQYYPITMELGIVDGRLRRWILSCAEVSIVSRSGRPMLVCDSMNVRHDVGDAVRCAIGQLRLFLRPEVGASCQVVVACMNSLQSRRTTSEPQQSSTDMPAFRLDAEAITAYAPIQGDYDYDSRTVVAALKSLHINLTKACRSVHVDGCVDYVHCLERECAEVVVHPMIGAVGSLSSTPERSMAVSMSWAASSEKNGGPVLQVKAEGSALYNYEPFLHLLPRLGTHPAYVALHELNTAAQLDVMGHFCSMHEPILPQPEIHPVVSKHTSTLMWSVHAHDVEIHIPRGMEPYSPCVSRHFRISNVVATSRLAAYGSSTRSGVSVKVSGVKTLCENGQRYPLCDEVTAHYVVGARLNPAQDYSLVSVQDEPLSTALLVQAHNLHPCDVLDVLWVGSFLAARSGTTTTTAGGGVKEERREKPASPFFFFFSLRQERLVCDPELAPRVFLHVKEDAVLYGEIGASRDGRHAVSAPLQFVSLGGFELTDMSCMDRMPSLVKVGKFQLSARDKAAKIGGPQLKCVVENVEVFLNHLDIWLSTLQHIRDDLPQFDQVPLPGVTTHALGGPYERRAPMLPSEDIAPDSEDNVLEEWAMSPSMQNVVANLLLVGLKEEMVTLEVSVVNAAIVCYHEGTPDYGLRMDIENIGLHLVSNGQEADKARWEYVLTVDSPLNMAGVHPNGRLPLLEWVTPKQDYFVRVAGNEANCCVDVHGPRLTLQAELWQHLEKLGEMYERFPLLSSTYPEYDESDSADGDGMPPSPKLGHLGGPHNPLKSHFGFMLYIRDGTVSLPYSSLSAAVRDQVSCSSEANLSSVPLITMGRLTIDKSQPGKTTFVRGQRLVVLGTAVHPVHLHDNFFELRSGDASQRHLDTRCSKKAQRIVLSLEEIKTIFTFTKVLRDALPERRPQWPATGRVSIPQPNLCTYLQISPLEVILVEQTPVRDAAGEAVVAPDGYLLNLSFQLALVGESYPRSNDVLVNVQQLKLAGPNNTTILAPQNWTRSTTLCFSSNKMGSQVSVDVRLDVCLSTAVIGACARLHQAIIPVLASDSVKWEEHAPSDKSLSSRPQHMKVLVTLDHLQVHVGGSATVKFNSVQCAQPTSVSVTFTPGDEAPVIGFEGNVCVLRQQGDSDTILNYNRVYSESVQHYLAVLVVSATVIPKKSAEVLVRACFLDDADDRLLPDLMREVSLLQTELGASGILLGGAERTRREGRSSMSWSVRVENAFAVFHSLMGPTRAHGFIHVHFPCTTWKSEGTDQQEEVSISSINGSISYLTVGPSNMMAWHRRGGYTSNSHTRPYVEPIWKRGSYVSRHVLASNLKVDISAHVNSGSKCRETMVTVDPIMCFLPTGTTLLHCSEAVVRLVRQLRACVDLHGHDGAACRGDALETSLGHNGLLLVNLRRPIGSQLPTLTEVPSSKSSLSESDEDPSSRLTFRLPWISVSIVDEESAITGVRDTGCGDGDEGDDEAPHQDVPTREVLSFHVNGQGEVDDSDDDDVPSHHVHLSMECRGISCDVLSKLHSRVVLAQIDSVSSTVDHALQQRCFLSSSAPADTSALPSQSAMFVRLEQLRSESFSTASHDIQTTRSTLVGRAHNCEVTVSPTLWRFLHEHVLSGIATSLRTAHLHFHSTPVPIATTASAASVAQSQNVTLCVSSDIRLTDTIVLGGPHGPRLHFVKDARRSNPGNTIKVSSADGAALVMSVVQLPNGELQCPVEVDDGMTVVLEGTEVVLRGLPATQVSLRNFVALGKRSIFVVPDSCLVSGEEPSVAAKYPAVPRASPLVRAVHSVHDVDLVANVHVRIWSHRQTLCFGTEANLSYHVERTRTGNLLSSVEDERGECILRRCTMESESGSIIAAPLDISTTIQLHKLSQGGINDVLTSIRLLFPAMHVKCTMGHMLLFMDSIRQFLLALKSLSPNHGGADRDSMAHQRRNKFRRFSPDAIRHTTGNERVPLVEVGVTAPELELTITSDFFTPVLSATLMEVSVNANGSRDGQSMSLLGTAQLTVCDFPPLESSRNLLQVTPEVAYQFTRFPTGCETCKCTVGCSNVHVTLPLVAALRSLHYQWTDGRVGCYAFHNSLGMPLLVVAPYGASEKHGGTVPYCCLPPSSTVEADLFQFSQTKFRIIAGDESILHSPDTLASLHTLGTEVDLCQLAEGCTFRFTMHRHPRGVLDAVLRMDEAKRYIHVTTSVHLHNELETVSVVFPGQLTTLTGGSSCYATMEALQQPVSLTVGEYQSSLDVPLITWGSLINSILLLDAVDGLEAGDAASTREDVLCRLGVHFVNAQTVALQVKMRVAPTEDAPYSSDHAAFVNVLVEKRPATVSPREGGHHLLPCYEVDVRVRAAIRINNCTSDRISVKIFTTNTSKGGDRDQEVKETSLAGKGHLHWFFEGTTPHRPHLSFAFLGNQGEEVTGNGNNLHYTNPVDVSFDGRRVVSMVARTGGAVALILEHADFCTINIKCMAVIQNGLPASVCLHATPTSIFASGATARVRDGEETSVYVPFNPKLAPSKHLDMMTAVCVAVGDEGATQSKSFIANVPTLSATLASEHKNSIAVFAATACPAHASGSVPHVSLQPVWGVHNAHPHLSLEIRAVGKEMDTLSVAPGARQDLFDFGLSSGTPLPHLQFRFGNHVEHTSPIYQWSPPICATALFDSRSPMGIKHMVDSTHTLHKMSAPPRQSGEATFSNLRVPTHRDAACFDECFSVLQLTPFVAGHRHTVSVALAQHSPCVLENRTRFDLQWSFTGAASDYHQMSGIDDRATIWAYLIPPHTDCFSCRSLVADGSPTLQLTLLNQPRLTSTTVDLVAAVAGKDAVKLGSQAFVLVTEDASTGRYFITITEDRSLESALLFEQRYVGHFEVFLRDIAVHTAVPFVRPSTTHLSQVPLLSFLDDATEGSSMYLKGIRRTSSDEKKVDALKQKDLDLVMVHVVGFYASGSWDREQLLASVEVGSLDVVDCTAPRPVYPIILHVGEAETSDRPREAGVSLAVHMLWPKRLAGGNMSRSSTTSNTDRPAEEVTPYAALQIEHLRLRSKPMVLSLHDSFLYVAKMAYQCIAEFQASFRDSLDANREHTTHKMMLDAMIKQLEVSEMSVEFTLTRRADRRFNPYESLPTAVAIPSIERAPIKIGATVARDLHQRSPSLVGVFADTFWLLYRRRLVLQLVKVVGSLELLGNPLALLDSWERGVKSLFHEVAVKQPLTGARELIRETASSSLHSVSLLSKFSSRTIAALSLDGDWVEQQENRHFVQQMAQRRSFFGDVGQGLLGGVEGAVGRTVKGVTRSGVSGLVTGAAFGAVSLVSRPVVSVLQGVGGATEFYSQKLRESSSCGSESSLEMYQHASRNFTTILTTLDEGSDQVANAQRELWATVRAQSLCVNKAAYKVVLDMIAKEQLIGSDASRRIVDTIGAYSLAVFADFYTFLDACTPEELQRWLHVALDAHFARQMQRERLQQCRSSSNLAGGRSASYASVDKREESMASVVTDASTNGDDLREKDGASAEDSLQRARQIKATLGVMTLARYVSADIFVRTCTVDEILAHVPPENLRNCFAVVMMRCGTEMLKSLIGDSSAAV